MAVSAKKTIKTEVTCPASKRGDHEDTISVGELRAFLATLDALGAKADERVHLSYDSVKWATACETVLGSA